jgi:hypothetical protein
MDTQETNSTFKNELHYLFKEQPFETRAAIQAELRRRAIPPQRMYYWFRTPPANLAYIPHILKVILCKHIKKAEPLFTEARKIEVLNA